MVGNIIVGIIVVALIVSGAWMWWMENGPSGEDHSSEETPTDDRKK